MRCKFILLLGQRLDQGSKRSSPGDGLSTYRLTKIQCQTATHCSYLHGRPVLGPSCNDFVYPGRQHFYNGATSKIDDGLTVPDILLHVLSLAVHLKKFLMDKLVGPF